MTRRDFTGRWRADLAASRLRDPAPEESLVWIAHSEPDLHVEMAITSPGHPATRIAFHARTTSEEITNTVLGGEWLSRSRWIGDELLIESRVDQSGRELHFCDYWAVSPDGRRLTMEHRDDDLAGQVTVLERLDAADDFAPAAGR